MMVSVAHFCLPKFGNTPGEYEDAFYPKKNCEQHGKRLRFAIADGATGGILSGKWAKILAKQYCITGTSRQSPNDCLNKAYMIWDRWKVFYMSNRKIKGKPVQWYEEPGLQAGAFSTLLGLTLEDYREGMNGEWEAVSAGDSCLFQIRGDRLILCFPIDNWRCFGQNPLLLSSAPEKNSNVLINMMEQKGKWGKSDEFFLLTDAFACWFIREYEKGRKPWKPLLYYFENPDRAGDFIEWTAKLRAEKLLRNDDVTMLRIKIL